MAEHMARVAAFTERSRYRRKVRRRLACIRGREEGGCAPVPVHVDPAAQAVDVHLIYQALFACTQWAAVRKAWRAWREHVLAARMARKEACVDELRLAVVNLQQVRVCMCAHAHLPTELNLHVASVRSVCPCACL
jgi:hypothetical protein